MLNRHEARKLKEMISGLLCGEVEWTGEVRFEDLAEAIDSYTAPLYGKDPAAKVIKYHAAWAEYHHKYLKAIALGARTEDEI